MSGNIWEWCWNWWDEDYYQKSPNLNPKGPDSGSYRVYRGGSWNYYPQYCQVACCFNFHPDTRINYLGFRLASSLSSNG